MPINSKEDFRADCRKSPDTMHISNLSPLVVLFGPVASGRTMALIRLTRYLQEKGYHVAPERSFRPPYYQAYQNVCDSFLRMCDNRYCGVSCNLEMLLVSVNDRHGRTVCQLLDAPGEVFFNPYEPQGAWHTSLDYIRNLRNERIWLYFVENNRDNHEMRMQYAQRIRQHVYDSSRIDKAVFVFSKVDKTDYLINEGEVEMPQLYNAIKDQYTDIFVPFENKPPLKWFKKYSCRFVPFSSGCYNPLIDTNGNWVVDYVSGHDVFPKMLWDAILRSISK